MENKRIIIIIILLIVIAGIIYHKNEIKNFNWNSNQSEEINLTESIEITKPGTYKLTGTITDGYITINTTGKVKLILNNVNITNSNGPAIYIKEAKLVEISTIKETINTLIDNRSDEQSTNINACIFSHDDLVLSGKGSLIIIANYENGIVTNDNLKVHSGNYTINAKKNGLRANNNIEINSGIFNINATTDGIHTDQNMTINAGVFKIQSSDDAIHADGKIEINGGTFDINGTEGIEATYIVVNNGTLNINATDDGINAGRKSHKYKPTIEINNGTIVINMSEGDTDGIDSNGNLYINGGLIDITANSPFDYEGEAKYTNGTLIINGKKKSIIENQR